jgi:S1-C subfamily serine protease
VIPAEIHKAAESVALVETDGGTGSGWKVADDRMLTAAHVADNEMVVVDGQVADVAELDHGRDTAVLDVPCGGAPVPLSDHDPAVGKQVWAVGYPGGAEAIVPCRVVGYDEAGALDASGGEMEGRTVLVDADPGFGSSGGMLAGLDADGRAVSYGTGWAGGEHGGVEDLGAVIPPSEIRRATGAAWRGTVAESAVDRDLEPGSYWVEWGNDGWIWWDGGTQAFTETWTPETGTRGYTPLRGTAEHASASPPQPYRASAMVDCHIPAAVQASASKVVHLGYADAFSGGGSAWPLGRDANGTVFATCAHSVPGGQCGAVGESSGQVIAADETRDCAAISVTGDHGSIPLAAADAPIGSTCYIVGYPVTEAEEAVGMSWMPRQHTITPAVVKGYSPICSYDTMQLDGYAAGGNSGGVVLNENGEAIGLYTSGYSDTNQGGCIPISQVRESLALTSTPEPSNGCADATTAAYRGSAEHAPASPPSDVAAQVLIDCGDGIGVGTAYPVATTPDGHVQYLTCDHVPRDGPFTVDGTPGTVALSDPHHDVAVIDVPAEWAQATPLTTLAATDPAVGSGVTMVGWANGEYAEIPGTVIDWDTVADMPGSVAPDVPMMIVQSDGSAGPGISGGPVLGPSGAVVGHVAGGNAEMGTVYVVPVSEIREVIGAQAEPAAEPAHEPSAAMA